VSSCRMTSVLSVISWVSGALTLDMETGGGSGNRYPLAAKTYSLPPWERSPPPILPSSIRMTSSRPGGSRRSPPYTSPHPLRSHTVRYAVNRLSLPNSSYSDSLLGEWLGNHPFCTGGAQRGTRVLVSF
jgi:hypothetical protein